MNLPSTPNPSGISIIICCYNSVERLPQTLRHLALQQISRDITWEIIVIDNASTDNTAQIAAMELSLFSFDKFKYTVLHEAVPGKAFALDTGIKQSTYEYILICDDDNWLSPNYIDTAFTILHADNKIGATGGQSTVVADTTLPEWFSNYAYMYAVGIQAANTGYLPNNKTLWGAGMIFRRHLYLEAYQTYPSLLTGPNKYTLNRGEDVEFCMRLLIMGYKLYYDERLQFRHFMPASRLTPEYRQQLFTGHDYQSRILNLYTRFLQFLQITSLKKSLLLIKSLFCLFCSKTLHINRWSHQHEAEIIFLLCGLKLAPTPQEVLNVKLLGLTLTARQ